MSSGHQGLGPWGCTPCGHSGSQAFRSFTSVTRGFQWTNARASSPQEGEQIEDHAAGLPGPPTGVHFVFAQIALATTSTRQTHCETGWAIQIIFCGWGEGKKYDGISVIESVEDLFPENSLSSLVHRWYLSIYHQSIYLSIWHLSNLYLSIIYHHYHYHLPSLITMSPYITPFKTKVRSGNSLHAVMCLPHPARLH